MIAQAVILAGGLGTRLGALTESTPKPMLDVGGRPFLDYLVDNVTRHGLTRILLLCGYKSEAMEAHFAGRPEVQIVVEDTPLGTGGALRHASAYLDERFFVLNGDTLFDTNILALVPAFRGLATLGLRNYAGADRAGWVECKDGRVEAFHTTGAKPGSLINSGVYLMSRDILGSIPVGRVSLESDILPLLATSGDLAGHRMEGYFLDIGVPSDFARSQTEVPARTRRPAIFFDRDGVLNHDDNYVHRPDQIRWIPGAIEAVRLANDAGWYAFVVTNQAGVAHGYYEEAAVHRLHAWMTAELQRHGAHIDRFEHSPNHPEGRLDQYRREDHRRKPGPGMILDLMASYPTDTARSWLIGDRDTDLAAAEAAGIGGRKFEGGRLDDLVSELMAASRSA